MTYGISSVLGVASAVGLYFCCTQRPAEEVFKDADYVEQYGDLVAKADRLCGTLLRAVGSVVSGGSVGEIAYSLLEGTVVVYSPWILAAGLATTIAGTYIEFSVNRLITIVIATRKSSRMAPVRPNAAYGACTP